MNQSTFTNRIEISLDQLSLERSDDQPSQEFRIRLDKNLQCKTCLHYATNVPLLHISHQTTGIALNFETFFVLKSFIEVIDHDTASEAVFYRH